MLTELIMDYLYYLSTYTLDHDLPKHFVIQGALGMLNHGTICILRACRYITPDQMAEFGLGRPHFPIWHERLNFGAIEINLQSTRNTFLNHRVWLSMFYVLYKCSGRLAGFFLNKSRIASIPRFNYIWLR